MRPGFKGLQANTEVIMKKVLITAIIFLFFSLIYAGNTSLMTVTSTSFIAGEMIPVEYTCEGTDISPEIAWSGAIKSAKSFMIICDDPDIPVKTPSMQEWVHWVVYNIPADMRSMKRLQPRLGMMPNGARQGLNDFKANAYGGPCPPFGVHRYFFRVYALDTTLDIAPAKATKKTVLEAAKNHIIGYGEMMGKYEKPKKKGVK
jgi:Raf kinase inhibitor-like YbhB/YbcL family protein